VALNKKDHCFRDSHGDIWESAVVKIVSRRWINCYCLVSCHIKKGKDLSANMTMAATRGFTNMAIVCHYIFCGRHF